MLREAARSALAGGAPDTAAEQLRRALAEPPDCRRSSLGACSSLATPNTSSATRLRPTTSGRRARPRRIRSIRARALTALAWTTHPDPPRPNASSFRSTSGRPPKFGPTIASSRCSSMRRGWAHSLLNPDLPDKFEAEADRVRGPAGADRGGVPAAVFRRPQGARRRPGRGGRRSRRTGGDASRLGQPGRSPAVADEHHDLLDRGRSATRLPSTSSPARHAARRAQRLAAVVGPGAVAAWPGPAPPRRPAGGRGRCPQRPCDIHGLTIGLHQDSGPCRGDRLAGRPGSGR